MLYNNFLFNLEMVYHTKYIVGDYTESVILLYDFGNFVNEEIKINEFLSSYMYVLYITDTGSGIEVSDFVYENFYDFLDDVHYNDNINLFNRFHTAETYIFEDILLKRCDYKELLNEVKIACDSIIKRRS